ncbi:hypothetical protein [Candidatus Symbiopectobacterium sp.]|nr:hypothetical protein [Candidatus Symbiopectobacterium sp.]
MITYYSTKPLIAGSTKTRYSATFRITKQGKLMLHSPPIPVELDF